jgi:hypothetical protein
VLTNGNLGEYVDANFSTYGGAYGFGINPTSHGGPVIAANVLAIDAGTDRFGVDSVDYTTSANGQVQLNEWRDETVTSAVLARGVTSFSAGQGGIHAWITGGVVTLSNEATGSITLPANGAAAGLWAASVVVGVSASGGYQLEVIYGDGSAYQSDGSSWSLLAAGVSAVSKPLSGRVRVLLTTGEAYEQLGASTFWDSPASDDNTAVA